MIVSTLSDVVTYKDKVGLALVALKLDEVLVISEKVHPDNVKLFIAVVKEYIDRDFGKRKGWEIIFSGDYTQVRKQAYINN